MVLAIAIVIPAKADEFKVPPEGSKLTWEKVGGDRTTNVVVGPSEGLQVTWTSNGRNRGAAFIFCWGCDPNRYDVEMDKLKGFFPLEKGKTVTFERTRESRTWEDTVTVKGRKTITTPAGEFDVFVVETKSESTSGSWSGTRTSYFPPALGWLVKYETKDSEGRDDVWQVTSVNGKTGVRY